VGYIGGCFLIRMGDQEASSWSENEDCEKLHREGSKAIMAHKGTD
jgi:hypothetical protein